MVQLFIDSSRVGVAGAVQLTWCVPKDVLAEVQTSQEGVWLLICVAPRGRRDSVKNQLLHIVPLNDGATYVSFKYAGPNRVFAKIFLGTRRDAERVIEQDRFGLNDNGTDWLDTADSVTSEIEAKKLQLQASARGFSRPAFEMNSLQKSLERLETKTLPEIRHTAKFRGMTEAIMVPDTAFAKEWPKWIMKAIEHFPWWRRTPTDECNRRGLAIGALALLSVWLPVSFLIRLFLVTLLVGIVGFRPNRMTIRSLYSLFDTDISDACFSVGKPYWLPYRPEHAYGFVKAESSLRYLLATFSPILSAVGAFIWSLLGPNEGPFLPVSIRQWWLAGSLVTLCAASIILIGSVLIVVVIGAVTTLSDQSRRAQRAEAEHRKPRFERLHALRDSLQTGGAKLSRRDVQRLECTDDCKPTGPRRTTVRLLFLEAKARVCKPMQGR